VKTGDRRFAGTDANVFPSTLSGTNGDSGDRNLSSSGNNFERDKWDEFEVEASNLAIFKRS